jgi:hypothetical protein
MNWSVLPRSSVVVALVTVVGTAAIWQGTGGAVFSPGDLRGADSTVTTLGGVESHAGLSRKCSACHTAPWSGERMSARCLTCHTDIQSQLRDTISLHAAIGRDASCLSCHGEHRGVATSITSLAGFGAQHERVGFPLDGAHAKATCVACHRGADAGKGFRGAPKTCIGCHEADDTHKGSLGANCGSCHGTSTWTGATFEHSVFPLNHGEGGTIACKTCHQDSKNYKSYTCYGCHEHDPARVARQHRGEVRATNLDHCIRCHTGGRNGEGGEHGEGR